MDQSISSYLRAAKPQLNLSQRKAWTADWLRRTQGMIYRRILDLAAYELCSLFLMSSYTGRLLARSEFLLKIFREA